MIICFYVICPFYFYLIIPSISKSYILFCLLKYSAYFKDIDETRLALAKSLGADFTIRVSSEKPEQLATNISEILGDHPDVTIECSGTNFGFSTGIYVRCETISQWYFIIFYKDATYNLFFTWNNIYTLNSHIRKNLRNVTYIIY